MKDNEVGITAIKLIFIMILIIIIILSGIVLAKRLWSETTQKDIKTDLLYMQAKCKVIYDKHIINEEEALIGEKIEEYKENEEINEIITSDGEWYKLNQENLNSIGAYYLNEEDGYIVNYETEEIIYTIGIEENGKVFYKLSDILEPKKEENNEEEQNEVNDENTEIDENNKEQEIEESTTVEQQN